MPMAVAAADARIARMLVVVALGGNALLRRGEPADEQHQRHNVELAVDALAQLAQRHRVVVTHGNGPQVGLLALHGDGEAGTKIVAASARED
jgi:carbamate kinase